MFPPISVTHINFRLLEPRVAYVYNSRNKKYKYRRTSVMIALQQCEISSISISPNFENWFSETLQNDSILLLVDNHYFTSVVEESFENWFSETLQNDSILLFADNHNFSMVEDNFENRISKTLQIDLILLGWG